MKLVLATHNRDKVGEIRGILSGLDVSLLTLDDFPGAPVPAEDGETLEANALLKARAIRAFTGLSALADDTGLEVDALEGAPGVRAARFAGEGASYAQNRARLLEALAGVPEEKRTARFRCVIAVALGAAERERVARALAAAPDRDFGARIDPALGVDALVGEGAMGGRITTAESGSGGFGYDSVFYDPGAGRTLAQMTAAEKNARSHRYRALVEVRALLLELGLMEEA
jgi:XTP/dITP diphosphohydrolase